MNLILLTVSAETKGQEFQGTTSQYRELNYLIQKFIDLFQVLKTLPPQREEDHMIPLCKGENPVVVKGYWYPHYQKGEIEKQVWELLKSCIIQPTSSPFSSLVLLVKEKDSNYKTQAVRPTVLISVQL